MNTQRQTLFAAALCGAFLWTPASAQVDLFEPINGFDDDKVYLYEEPGEGEGNSYLSSNKVEVSTFGSTDDIYIVGYFPANALLKLYLPTDEAIYVEFDEVDAVNQEGVDQMMARDAPLGACLSARSRGSSLPAGVKLGTSRGVGC